MSSILDALEKASKERAARKGDVISTDAVGQQALVEKRLREEREAQSRTMRRAWMAMGGVALLLMAGTGAAWVLLFRSASSQPAETSTPAVIASPAPDPGPQTVVVAATAPPTPEPVVESTPAPTPQPTPAATEPPATVVAEATPVPTPLRRKLSQRFSNGQIVHPSEVGLEVGGVLELSSGFVALVNNKQIRKGQSVENITITDIGFGQLMLDLGDGVVVRARF